MQEQYPRLGGLQDPLRALLHGTSSALVPDRNPVSFYIFHDGRFHWVAVVRHGNEICIYDSLINIRSPKVSDVVLTNIRLTMPDLWESENGPSIHVMNVFRQIGAIHCGYYAIAYLVDLANGNDPCALKYLQNQMPRHLAQCILQNNLTSFPSVPRPDLPRSFSARLNLGQ